jgi:hypothetical protein
MSKSEQVPSAGFPLAFQLWDYSPSHRTLLYRSPPINDVDPNTDLQFKGVRHIAAPTLIHLIPFRPLPETSLTWEDGDKVKRYNISGSHSITAESYSFASNSNDLFELPDATARTRWSGHDYELAVVAALSKTLESVEPVRSADSGVDLELMVGESRIYVEVKRVDATPPARLVRRVVMQLSAALGGGRLGGDSLLVVLSGASSPIVAELEKHLVTALGTYKVSAVSWEPGDDPEALRAAVDALASRV